MKGSTSPAKARPLPKPDMGVCVAYEFGRLLSSADSPITIKCAGEDACVVVVIVAAAAQNETTVAVRIFKGNASFPYNKGAMLQQLPGGRLIAACQAGRTGRLRRVPAFRATDGVARFCSHHRGLGAS